MNERRMNRKNRRFHALAFVVSAAFLLCLFLGLDIFRAAPVASGADSEHVIKFACVAPEGSLYVRLTREWDQELRTRTGNRARIRIYPGGILGEEADVIRKMRAGQVHATGVTGVGMGEMLPESRILELPRLFHNYDELDLVMTNFEDHFAEAFAERGYVFLGFTEVGPIHLFSQNLIRSIKDLRQSKVWAWESDPISAQLFKVFDTSAVPLSLLNVLASLQTKVIDAVYGSPLAVVTMQWHRYLQYMGEEPLGYAAGVIAMDKRAFDALPPDVRAIQLELGRKYTQRMREKARLDNAKALRIMKKRGLTVVAIDRSELRRLDAKATEVWEHFSGSFYPPELLEKIQTVLREHRGTQAARRDTVP